MKSFCENLYKKRKIVSADVSRADVCPTDITKELIKVNGKKKKLGDINRQNNNDSEIASDRLFWDKQIKRMIYQLMSLQYLLNPKL